MLTIKEFWTRFLTVYDSKEESLNKYLREAQENLTFETSELKCDLQKWLSLFRNYNPFTFLLSSIAVGSLDKLPH